MSSDRGTAPAPRPAEAWRGLSEAYPWETGPHEPGRAVLAVVALCIGLTPLVSPKGPGNGAPIDLFVAIGVATAMLWAIRRRARLNFPYFVPMTAYVVAGLVAAMLSAVPFRGGIAAGQEIFLFLWCAALATICRTPRALAVAIRAWAVSATLWAGVMVAGVVGGIPALSGASEWGRRAQLFFDHPNMAGNYFMIAIFVVVASGFPRRRWVRAGACLLLLTAMFFTGSNAALLSLVGGTLVMVFLNLRLRRGLMPAIATLTSLVLVLGVGWTTVVPPLVAAAEQSDDPLLRYTVGRSPESADKREELFIQQYELFEGGRLLGIGPAATKHELGTGFSRLDKEAHNDYLATLVERGPLGLLAVLALIAAVGARLMEVTRHRLLPQLAAAVPVPAALAGACAAFALTAVTHEVLHYRWFWALLGFVAATHLLARSADQAGARSRWPAR
ncbi:O-antigen ligase [Geodermatophilus bullaregiensis]|uniref:O-antigen ligase family protein n=1 Tax=Geodermatophilus bullaregiensis TaxID=1564160 RepID=UPI0019583A98|nr:O-antigen ligase family protein [Geodermatophilus bullaregiensis]MBM7808962.1 O-antigen ligase [Geodermatophilus bullaregiensis]